MNNRNNNQPRDPIGQYSNKPGVNGVSSLSLSQPRSITDPEFQHITAPYPHLDGAIIEHEDESQSWIDVKTNRFGMEEAVVGGSKTRGRPYRIVSFNGDPDRLDDELTMIDLHQRVADGDESAEAEFADQLRLMRNKYGARE